MEIRIDTSKDSNEEIRKAIRMLQALVGENDQSDFKSAPVEASPELFSIFSDSPSPAPLASSNSQPSSAAVFTSSSSSKPSTKQLLDDIRDRELELY